MKAEPLSKVERDLARTRKELQALKSRYNGVCDELEQTREHYEVMNDVGKRSLREIEFNRLKASGESTAILVLSDWHVSEVVNPETINGLNSYNIRIAERRVKAMFERAVMALDVARGMSKINNLVVACIGDFISGSLHDDQKETDELSPTESIDLCEDLIIGGLRFIKKETKTKITVVTCYGNHGRTTPKPRSTTAYKTNYEQLMYWQLRKHYSDEFVWKVEKGYHNLLEIYGRTYRFHHGDCIKYFGGMGGLQIPAMKAIAAWDRNLPAYYDVFGHYHTTEFARKYAINGSLVGYNDYAMRNKCPFEEPSQNLLVTSRKRGNVLAMKVFAD